MDFNPTVIVALITAISAIFAPSLATFLTNSYQAKSKKYEYFQKQKLVAYENFCTASMAYIIEYTQNGHQENNCTSKSEFLRSYEIAYLHSNLEVSKLLRNFSLSPDETFKDEAFISTFLSELSEITSAMNSDIRFEKDKI